MAIGNGGLLGGDKSLQGHQERHTCIKDDGGTPNRRCDACEVEGKEQWQPGHRNTQTHVSIRQAELRRVPDRDAFEISGPAVMGGLCGTKDVMQSFVTGATRSDDSEKIDPEGFLSPLVLVEYSNYMRAAQRQDDGKMRASDNWQLGMPFFKYMKSLMRHVMQLWLLHRGYTASTHEWLREVRAGEQKPVTVGSALSGIIFNAQGYFHEYLMDHEAWTKRVVSEPPEADVITIREWRKRKTA